MARKKKTPAERAADRRNRKIDQIAAAHAARREAALRRAEDADDAGLVETAGSPVAQRALRHVLRDAGQAAKTGRRWDAMRPWLRFYCRLTTAARAAVEDAAAGVRWERAAGAWGGVLEAAEEAAGAAGTLRPLAVADDGAGFEAALADALRKTPAKYSSSPKDLRGVPEPGDGCWSMAAVAVEAAGRPLAERRVVVYDGDDRITRQPAVLNLATLQPIAAHLVDGEPVASNAPALPAGGGDLVLYAPVRCRSEQPRLFPKTLGGVRIHDLIVSAAAAAKTWDHRSPALGDLLRTAHLAFALTDGGPIPEAAGSEFLTGINSKTGVRRWHATTETLRKMLITVDRETGRWLPLADVEPDTWDGLHRGDTFVAAPMWWRFGDASQPDWRVFRPSGLLWRTFPKLAGRQPHADVAVMFSGLARMLAGWEALLSWSPPVGGRGKTARLPELLRPVRKGGPGPEVFVGWRETMHGAGELVRDDDARGTDSRRYRRRLQFLVESGYLVAPGAAAAAAGDTVEITKIVRGSKSQEPGVRIRATARFCEAAAGKAEFDYVPATRLLGAARA